MIVSVLSIRAASRPTVHHKSKPTPCRHRLKTRLIKSLTAKHTDPEADTSDLEGDIDKLVYELYNLTEAEIAIVEGSV